MSILFSPLSIGEVTFKNRIVVSPMCQYSAQDGFANDWHLVHLGSRAVGGAGLIIVEATSITPEGRISPEDLGIWKDEHIPELKRITNFIHQHGAIAGVQLSHAGRKAGSSSPWNGSTQLSLEEGGWQTLAPSAIAFNSNNRPPIALDKQGIERIINSFKAAAERALEAGFQLIEVHAAHGYLINEFLSPLSNQRQDEYGGSFENRIRLLLEVVQAIREVWPESYPLFIRISATDWVENGWQIEDSVNLSKILKANEVDLIDCSSGGVIPGVKIPLVPGYQSPLAEEVRKNADILTATVGLITEPEQAEQILQDGKADLILFARESLRNPYFPLIFAQKLNDEVDWPLQYERAKPK